MMGRGGRGGVGVPNIFRVKDPPPPPPPLLDYKQPLFFLFFFFFSHSTHLHSLMIYCQDGVASARTHTQTHWESHPGGRRGALYFKRTELMMPMPHERLCFIRTQSCNELFGLQQAEASPRVWRASWRRIGAHDAPV